MLVETEPATQQHESAAADVRGAHSVLGHACLNALATLRLGLEALDCDAVSLTQDALLVADMWEEVARLECLARAMIRGLQAP